MAVPEGWVDDRRVQRSAHDEMVSHIKKHPREYMEAAGFGVFTASFDGDVPEDSIFFHAGEQGHTQTNEATDPIMEAVYRELPGVFGPVTSCVLINPILKKYVANSRPRCEQVLDGWPLGFPDVLVYSPYGKIEPSNVMMVFEVKSYNDVDIGQTLRQLKLYLSRCPNAFGCLVLPSPPGWDDFYPDDVGESFRDEGIAIVSDGIVKYRIEKKWDAPYAGNELEENYHAICQWSKDHPDMVLHGASK
jgi:hypothetical protein